MNKNNKIPLLQLRLFEGEPVPEMLRCVVEVKNAYKG